jgi:hypothetical protein
LGCFLLLAVAAYCALDLVFDGPFSWYIRAAILIAMSMLASL